MDLDELRALTPSAAIDHIVSEHHEPLRRQLAELERACTALTSGGALTGAALSLSISRASSARSSASTCSRRSASPSG